jgi:hypothetical protein
VTHCKLIIFSLPKLHMVGPAAVTGARHRHVQLT